MTLKRIDYWNLSQIDTIVNSITRKPSGHGAARLHVLGASQVFLSINAKTDLSSPGRNWFCRLLR